MPYKYTLIKDLFYSTKDNGVNNSNAVNTLTEPNTIKSDNIRTLRTSFGNGFKKLDGKLYNISYSGVRVPNTNSISNVSATFKETFIINDGQENSVTGNAVYSDTGSSDITTVSKTKWNASGTGKLADVNFATIEYDNNGSKFGYPNSRRIRLFKLELVDDIKVPNLAGDWIYQVSVLRRPNSTVKPDFSNIINTNPSPVKITQQDKFLVMELPADATRPVASYLLGTLTYVADHWKLTFSDEDDNGVFTLTQSDKNVWSGTYTESGFNGTRQQFQTAGIATIKKM